MRGTLPVPVHNRHVYAPAALIGLTYGRDPVFLEGSDPGQFQFYARQASAADFRMLLSS